MEGCRAIESQELGGIQVQGEMLIMVWIKGAWAYSSGAEWDMVSRPSHTLTCFMLLQLHKLPHKYPRGTLEVEKTGQRGRE